MSALVHIHYSIMPVALGLLPAKMDTLDARILLLAIGLQESRFEHRQQVGGPAHGFWQFEEGGGVHGVLTHKASRNHIQRVAEALVYAPEQELMYEAIVHNDVLACAFARLLLWTHPEPLPTQAQAGWNYYLACWRPGKPHRATWNAFYSQAQTMATLGRNPR